MQHKNLCGATLTEILAAVGIVAILAAVLFPVFVQERTKEEDNTCISNLRQIGLGFIQYLQDYDERMPIARHWGSEVYPYIKNPSVYQCPRDFNKSTDITSPLSYAMNKNLDRITLSKFRSPSSTVLATEYDSTNVILMPENNSSIFSATNGLESKKIATWGSITRLGRHAVTPPRHDPNIVFLAADGHVKAIRPNQVLGGANALKPNSPSNMMRAAGTTYTSDHNEPKWVLTFSAI